MIFQFPYKLISFAKMLSSGYIVLLVTIVTNGQNFDDYFDEPAQLPIFTTSLTEKTTTTASTATTASITQTITPLSSTTRTPSTDQTVTPSTSPTPFTTSEPSTNQMMTLSTSPTISTFTTSTTSKPTFSIRIEPSIYLLLEELVNKSFEKLERKFDRLIDIMTASKPDEKPDVKKNTEKMGENTSEETIIPKLTRLAEENVFDDPFFNENTDEVLAEKKKIRIEKENFNQLMIISLGSAACGTTLLLMVVLFLHLQNKNKKYVKTEVEVPDEEPVYNELSPPMAVSENEDGIPYADADGEEIELASI